MPHPIPTAISTATEMLTNNIIYAYGFKYEPITPTKINTLASMYPTVYTPSIKTMTLNKVGKIGIDCSGFICKAFGIPHIGSSQLKSQMIHLYPTSDPSHLVNGMLIWRNGHIGLIEVDDTGEAWILEAKSTADDLVRTKYSARGNSFTYYGELTGVDYTNARKINSPTHSHPSAPLRELIDISHHNTINLSLTVSKFKDVIIRAGYRSSTTGSLIQDKKFTEHTREALANNMRLGFYFYDQSINETEAIQQADWTISQIRDYPVTYPVYIDSEYANQSHSGRADNITKDQRTKNIIAFCSRIKEAGFIPGVYASDNWFKTMLNYSQFKQFDIWCARYSVNPPSVEKYEIWQYGSANIPGSVNPIDVNHLYKEYCTDPLPPSHPVPLLWNEITASTLNIRNAPSTSGKILYQMHKGDKVNIYLLRNNWCKISSTDEIWCSYKYIYSSQGTVSNCSKLNCRRTPVSGQADFILSVNDTVNILHQDPLTNWFYIEFHGKTGYVSNKYIKL